MDFKVLHYSSLNKDQLYKLIHLRIKVFVVEQNCPYQDLDEFDKISYHVFGTFNATTMAVGRIIPYKKNRKVVIGRIAVDESYRNKGYAKKMMKEIINFIIKEFPGFKMELSAQTYLVDFYNSLGFSSHGSEYLEDGIPHIYMSKNS